MVLLLVELLATLYLLLMSCSCLRFLLLLLLNGIFLLIKGLRSLISSLLSPVGLRTGLLLLVVYASKETRVLHAEEETLASARGRPKLEAFGI